MADIDRSKLAYHVASALDERELSFADAQEKYEGITKGLLSRVRNGIQISAANLLVICFHFELDPFDYLAMDRKNPHSDFGRSHEARRRIAEILNRSEGSSSCQS